jgi:DMSO/TMAO reductase YedYZ heme-binding membrane subunit
MGIGVSVFLLAVGAILAFAVEVRNTSGIDLDTVGVILMVVGIIGLVFSAMFWSSWCGWGRRG